MNTNKTNIRRMTLGIATMAAALAASGLMSCSSENMVIDEPRDRTEIRFNVTNSRPSRATTHYGAAAEISHFTVSAWVRKSATDESKFGNGVNGNSPYFKDELIEWNAAKSEWEYHDKNVRYWPENNEVLDFYAWVDDSGDDSKAEFTWSGTLDGSVRPKLSVTTAEDASDMVDILTTNNTSNFTQSCTEKGASKTASLSFGHALAQVNVKVKVDNPKIQMQIAEVALVNINTKGDYYFMTPKDDVSKWDSQSVPSEIMAYATKDETTGEYPVVKNGKEIVDGVEKDIVVGLTGEGNTFMVIPGTYAAGSNPATDNAGTFFRLSCKVWNIADATDKNVNDLQIFGENGKYADLYVPATFDWKEGTRYTYTLSFGKGNAGIDSDGKPTLVLMDWNLTDMGDWETGTTTDPIEK